MPDDPADFFQQLLARAIKASPYGVNYCVLGAIAGLCYFWSTQTSATAQAVLVQWAAAAGFIVSLAGLLALAVWDAIEKLRAQCNAPPQPDRQVPPHPPPRQPQDYAPPGPE